MTLNTDYQGSCLCGQTVYHVKNIREPIAHCHCSDCRKFHGAAFSTFGEVKLADLNWVCGAHLLKSFTAPNGSIRQFCQECGSSLTFQSKHPNGYIEFALATLDNHTKLDGLELKPDAHIFLDSKVDWFEPADDLSKWPTRRGKA